MFAFQHTAGGQTPPEHHIFFVCRASLQKSALIATEFNLEDQVISHVGLGIMKNNDIVIFHVDDRSGNAMQKSTRSEFFDPASFYYCVYSMPLSLQKLKQIDSLLQFHPPVKFDQDLSLENDKLYCSEFCLSILTAVDPEKFAFRPLSRKISNPFVRSYLGRDTLTYIPPDFFLAYPGIQKVSDTILLKREVESSPPE